MPEAVTPPPRVESIHGHTRLWSHKDKAAERGPVLLIDIGVAAIELVLKSIHHFFLLGPCADKAIPRERIAHLPWFPAGRNPPSHNFRFCHKAKTRKSMDN